jgi:hypothetical protein
MILQYSQSLLPYLEMLAIVSGITFGLSIFLIPWFIGRLPVNYFLNAQKTFSVGNFRLRRLPLLVLRNLLGILLVIAGVLMLFLPGQGILTILIGFLCMSFPGKQRLINYLLRKKSLQTCLNWTRKKMSRPPFLWQ